MGLAIQAISGQQTSHSSDTSPAINAIRAIQAIRAKWPAKRSQQFDRFKQFGPFEKFQQGIPTGFRIEDKRKARRVVVAEWLIVFDWHDIEYGPLLS